MTTERNGVRRWAWLRRVDRRWLVRVVGIGLGGFLLGYLFTAVVFFRETDRPPVVTVPDVYRQTRDSAAAELARYDLELELGDTLPHPDVPAGRVLAQSPLAGHEIAPGSQVRVILSTGPPRRAVPVVTALTREQATRLLAAWGFRVQVQEVPDLRPAGRVVAVDPAPGTPLAIPATVRLRVSTGPPMVEVPDLRGLPEEEARGVLEAAGLTVGEVEYQYAGPGARRVVLTQQPPPGDSIRQGQAVRLRVATDELPDIIIR